MKFNSTLITIILSRIKKTKTTKEIEFKRKQCKTCEFNTLNIKKLTLKQKLIKLLSDFYSFTTFNRKVDVLGNCTACELCSVYYKTIDEEHCPHPGGDKWKSNLIQNKKWK